MVYMDDIELKEVTAYWCVLKQAIFLFQNHKNKVQSNNV